MMIGRRKKQFFEMVRLLREIEADQADLELVRSLNLLILKEVIRAELKQDEHRATFNKLTCQLKTGRGSKEASRAYKTKIKRTAGFIQRYAKQIYIWKCCGDALAFIYLDKFSIKHAFYDTDDYQIKRDSGMLRGKRGLPNELVCLFSAIEHGVPAVLCDITNTLRYGDVCLLGASDPALIEVKSSPRQNGRGKRQAAKMKRLRDFFETDGAIGFRGKPGETKRQVLTVAERTNVDALNECIIEARREGLAVSRPEPGVTYIVLNGKRPDYSEILRASMGERQVAFILNADKNAFAWAPYMPFILTIRDPQHIYEFIEGDLFIIVVVSMDELCRQMVAPGWEVQFEPDANYTIHCLHPESGAVIGISQHFVARAGYEFISLAWIAESLIPSLVRCSEDIMEFYGPQRPADIAVMRQRLF